MMNTRNNFRNMMKHNAYAKAGVDVSVEAKASKILYEAAKKTFANRKGNIGDIVIPFDDFSGIRAIDVSNLPRGSFMSLGFDGAGTKVEIADHMGVYNTIAHDLIAMVADDAVLRGGEPVVAGSVLDIKTLGSDEKFLPIIQQIADGYEEAAKLANISIINGELAQMGNLVGGMGNFPFHWGAALIWFAKKEKLFTGKEIQIGDSVVMLKEHGFRANGLSLVRKIFKEKYGDNWYHEKFEDSTLGLKVLTPSIIYSKAVIDAHGGFNTPGKATVHGVSHITGGGIPEKLGRVLRPSGLGVKLDNIFEPPNITKHAQEVGNISDKDAYGTWNMGNGMAIITPEPERVIEIMKDHNIDAQIAGVIVQEIGVKITSKGIEKYGEEVIFKSK